MVADISIPQLVNKAKRLEDFVKEHRSELDARVDALEKECEIQSADKLEQIFKKKAEQERDLKIGILGRVKAGKSSFLNALVFQGKNILPKAATPMTAALTILEYGESFEAEVNFYTAKERAEIKEKHAQYQKYLQEAKEKQYEKLKQQQEEEQEKQKNQERRLKLSGQSHDAGQKNQVPCQKSDEELYKEAEELATQEFSTHPLRAHFEQYEQMQQSKIDFSNLPDRENLKCKSYEELGNQLNDYVGSSGKYMPFTKSITLRLNEERLKEVQIIDTPGMDDPIVSREERTRELIASCDVVFLISPSGQFLNARDLELLETIEQKNGIKEFRVVASQFDTVLLSPEIQEGGDLSQSIERALKNLNSQQQSVFSTRYKEFGKSEVIFSSGVGVEIANHYDHLQDPNAQKVLENLQEDYPDFFSNKQNALSNLELLANMDKVRQVLEQVRAKKEEILIASLEETLQSKFEGLEAYQQGIAELLQTQIHKLQTSDLDALKTKLTKLGEIKEKVKRIINTSFVDAANEFSGKLGEELKEKIKKYLEKIEHALERSQEIKTETGTRERDTERDSWFFKKLWADLRNTRYKTEVYTETYKTLKTLPVRKALQETILEIQNTLDRAYKDRLKGWRKTIKKDLFDDLGEELGEENSVYVDIELIESSLYAVIARIELPELSYPSDLPDVLKQGGEIVGDGECEKYIKAAHEFFHNLGNEAHANINHAVQALEDTLKGAKIGDKLVDSYQAQIQQLEKNMGSQQESIARYQALKEEVLAL
ncbi:dynamin family protein [Helicobacter baculiformis]|uniref:Dynamin family protein n=1 Tax=Helicobacter baculiformis TaxID=427351 RepID=A0ABV7ZK18_9HELI|nr:dynamin family protein [Helicobacter baculiformis]